MLGIMLIFNFDRVYDKLMNESEQKYKEQSKYQSCFENLEESIIFIDKGQIEYVNYSFLTHFYDRIKYFKNKIEAQPQVSWCQLFLNTFKKQSKIMSEKQIFPFLKIKVFQKYQSQSSASTNEEEKNKQMSLYELSCMPPRQLKKMRVVFIQEDKDDEESMTEQQKVFQIKLTQYDMDDEESKMIQIVDISKALLLDKKIMQTQILEIVNASVSHELRNPLNSLISQNIKKEALYKNIQKMIETGSMDIPELKNILKELFTSNKVQSSSAKVMKYLIQDLLDFAQMKAGKFRKNIQEFDVKDIIDEMMSIEQEKAKNKGVSLHVEYLNIGNVFNPYLKQYSAKMKSDAGRI